MNILGYIKTDGAVLVGTGDTVQGHAIRMKEKDRLIMREILNKYGVVKGKNIWLPAGVKGKVKFTTWSSKGNMRDCTWAGFDFAKQIRYIPDLH